MTSHLFRGLRKGKLVYSKDCYDFRMFFSLIDENTLMLFSGKNDINNVPIYEGDYVIEYHKLKKENGKVIYRVDWDAKQMGFLFRFYVQYQPNPPMLSMDYPARYKYVKVIGNVYQNPEMDERWQLKVQQTLKVN